MSNQSRSSLLLAAALALLGACQKGDSSSPKGDKAAPPPAAKPASSDPECIAPWDPTGLEEAISAGERKLVRTGSKLNETTADADDQAVIGLIANLKEDTPENLENIKKALAFFKEQQVDSIVVNGDLGETESQMTNALMPIAETGLPVLVTIGNREKKSDFNQALKAVAAKHPAVINMNTVRLAAFDDLAFVSMPGYHDKAYLHSQEGCLYVASDVEATKPIIKAAGAKTVVFVSHGPPRQDGAEALDRTLEQANVGDPHLAAMLRETGVKIGVFANIQEAGGRATDLSGSHLIGPDKSAAELFVNPGAIDAVSWKMNDQTRSVGMAAVLIVKGKEASFRVFRVPGGDAAAP